VNRLENKTISLRAPEPEDLDLLYLWENNTEVWQISGTLVPFSRYVLKQYLENAGKDIYEMKQLRLIIQLNSNKRPVAKSTSCQWGQCMVEINCIFCGLNPIKLHPNQRSSGL